MTAKITLSTLVSASSIFLWDVLGKDIRAKVLSLTISSQSSAVLVSAVWHTSFYGFCSVTYIIYDKQLKSPGLTDLRLFTYFCVYSGNNRFSCHQCERWALKAVCVLFVLLENDILSETSSAGFVDMAIFNNTPHSSWFWAFSAS